MPRSLHLSAVAPQPGSLTLTVTKGHANKYGGTRQSLLGRPSNVPGNEGKGEHENSIGRAGEIIAGELGGGGLGKGEHGEADDRAVVRCAPSH